MEFKAMANYLFFYNHTVSGVLDIEADITNLRDYLNEFEQLDFNSWLQDNDLVKEYNDYIKYID